MRYLLIVVFYAASIALPVAAIVWAVSLSSSVHRIEATLERMDQRRSTAPGMPAPGPAPTVMAAAAPASAAPDPAGSIDIEPFVD